MFRIEIETSNAAFAEQPGYALAEILESVAGRVREDLGDADASGRIRDVNGNSVGMWQYTAE